MAPNFDQLATVLRQKLIFDGRNLYDPEHLAAGVRGVMGLVPAAGT